MTDSLRVIREWYELLAAGDLEGAVLRLDPQIEWIEAESSPYGEQRPIRGRDAVMATV